MPQSEEQYVFYFKIVYTDRYTDVSVSKNLTINKFIETITPILKNNLEIPMETNIEIVEAGQYHNINGRDAELAPPLEPSEQTLEQIYGNRHSKTAFYIRLI